MEKLVIKEAEKLEYNYSLRRRNSRRVYPRLYIGPEKETFMENFLVGRRNRPTRLYRSVLPEIFERFGLPEDTKAVWSRHAGCSMCPCSPGFILKHPDLKGFGDRYDLRVTVGRSMADEVNRAVAEELIEEAKETGRLHVSDGREVIL